MTCCCLGNLLYSPASFFPLLLFDQNKCCELGSRSKSWWGPRHSDNRRKNHLYSNNFLSFFWGSRRRRVSFPPFYWLHISTEVKGTGDKASDLLTQDFWQTREAIAGLTPKAKVQNEISWDLSHCALKAAIQTCEVSLSLLQCVREVWRKYAMTKQ